jgi:UDP-glucuronate 4-epimerase
MKVLVTGGAGFIGSHVAERLVRDGHEVCIVDELNDYYAPALKEENLASLRSAGPFAFYRTDICNEPEVASVFRKHPPELVIHLAARAGVRPSLEQPLLYEHVNVRGTLVLLEACRGMGVRDFIFASSSSVYGAANQVPFSEEDRVDRPISPYAATKIAGEKLCYAYSHLYGIRTTCLRFFTVYGPRQRPDLAIRKFVDMIARGETIPVFGDGSSRRDYTFIEDIVGGILAAAGRPSPYEIFNLGNSSPVDLMTLIQTIESAVGKKARIEWLPEQPGDVPITYADVSKAHRLLGYSSRTKLPDGIRQFVEWYHRPSRSITPAA